MQPKGERDVSAAVALAVGHAQQAAAKVPGPRLDDAWRLTYAGELGYPIAERCAAFSARLAAFRAVVGVWKEEREPRERPPLDMSRTCGACGGRTVEAGVCAACGARKVAEHVHGDGKAGSTPGD